MTTTTTRPRLSPTAARLKKLTALAGRDPQAAQDEAWDWLLELGQDDPATSQAALLELLDLGSPAEVDGRSDGVLLRWVTDTDLGPLGNLLFPLVRGYVAQFGSPWLGKRYDRARGRGSNTLSPAAYWLAKVAMPQYRLRKDGDVYEGFEMYTRVEESVLVPGSQVLVLDFESMPGNPAPVNLIHDEVVEIVPGTYLGTKTLHYSDRYHQVAWWATKSEVRG